MPRSVNVDDDSEALLAYIESGAARLGKSVQIPSPDGRTQAGWTTITNLKVQPEVVTMLDQLRAHPLFKGQWKTSSQVAWSMIYLGLKACRKFYADEDHSWDEYKSNYVMLDNVLSLFERQRREKALTDAARHLKTVIHNYLDKGTECGKWQAWKTLDKIITNRSVIEDTVLFDRTMCDLGPVAIGSNTVFDTRAGDLWRRLYPTIGGEINEREERAIYDELTVAYFDEMNEIHNPPPEEE